MAKQIVMDHTGHSEHVFDKANKVSLAEAEERFNALIKKGYRAARTVSEGQHELIRSFDPNAEQTLFIPHLKGG